MKYKQLRFSLLCMLVMLCGGYTWAQEQLSETLTPGTKDGYAELTVNKTGVASTGGDLEVAKGDIVVTSALGYIKEKELTIYKNGSMTIGFKDGVEGYITKVELTVKNYHFATPNASTGWTAGGTYDNTTKFTDRTENEVFTTTATDKNSFTISNASGGKTTVTEITVSYVKTGETQETLKETTLTLSGNYETEGTVGDVLTLPEATVTADATTVTGATISWTSSNEEVATIEGNEISLLKAGTTTIKASFEGDDNYKGCEKSYTLTVKAKKLVIGSLKELQENVSETSTPVTLTLNNVQVTAIKGTNNAYLCDADGYGALVYTKNLSLTAGQVLNGTIDVAFVLYNGATEITNFTTEGLTITEAEVTPTEKTIEGITVANQSMLATIKGVTYNAEGKYFTDGTNTIAYYDNFKAYPTLEDGKKYDVTGIIVMFNTTIEICPRTADDVVEAEEATEIPENAIWTSDEPTAIDWSGAINIAAEKFANAKIGDRIVVEIVNPSDGGQVLPKSEWKDIEGSVPVNSSTTEVAFIITGDMMRFIKAGGLMIAGQNCSTKLVTLETTELTGSEESIWVGNVSGNGNFPINYIHFVNANNKKGVKAGDFLHIVATPIEGENQWLELFDSNWSTKLTADGFDIIITEDMVDKLTAQYSQSYINFGGYNITQVEFFAREEPVEEQHIYVLGSMNDWSRTNMIELGYNEEQGGYVYTLTTDETAFYLAFADYQMTEEEANEDEDWSKFNSTYRLAVVEGNYKPTLGEQVQLQRLDGSFKLGPGSYTFVITKDLMITITGTESQEEYVEYIVAGTPASIFGSEWSGTFLDNLMAKQDDGTYSITYKDVPAQDNIQFKIVKNGSEWIGIDGNNVTFNVTSQCDVTITYNPETGEITVTGDGVAFATELIYETVFAVGNGDGTWLNGAGWDPGFADNEMTKLADGIWEITFENVPAGTERQVKFALDGTWAQNFGGTFEGFGVESDAEWDSGNIIFDTTEKTQNVTLKLDLTNFDITTKKGAKFTVTTVADAIEAVNIRGAIDEKQPAYNLSGQRVNKNYRGVVIQNGRKFRQ